MAFAFVSKTKLHENLHAALAHIRDTLDIPLAVRMEDGSTIALGNSMQPLPIIFIRSNGVIASLMRHPSLENLVRHYSVGNLALLEGDLITTVQNVRARIKKKDVRKLSKKHLLRLLWPFLLVRGEKAVPRHDFKKDDAGTTHKNENNQNYIQFHYDVGNEFYQLFLDPEMQYSCAYFKTENGTLEQAQQDKLEMICRKLRLKPSEKFLDIGCGWGGLLCYAALHYGVEAHGITLSTEQYEYTKAKIKRLGLEGKVTVEIRDYRVMEGSFDKIASIGMFEHVGIKNFPAYFQKIRSLLKDGGIVLNHGIARRGKAGRKSSLSRITPEKRMILKYIFPGAELAPIGYSVNAMEAQGFEIHDVEAWREHYALTCKHWCQRLAANKERAIALVGPERYNLWVGYLAGVAFGFLSGSVLIFQTVATKRAKAKGPSGLPLTRDDLYKDDNQTQAAPKIALEAVK